MPYRYIDNTFVSLKSRDIHKFYEPIVLRLALNQGTRDTAVRLGEEAPLEAYNEEQTYNILVYKLAHICDNIKGDGGRSITAFMILWGTGRTVEYWFASNQRTEEELSHTAEFFQALLEKAGDAEGKHFSTRTLHDDILQDVHWFNRRRIQTYVKEFSKHVQQCLQKCSDESTEESQLIRSGLEEFIESVDLGYFARLSEMAQPQKTEFLGKCKLVSDGFLTLKASRAGELVINRSLQGRMPGYKSEECWSELQHAASRILAYYSSVHFIIRAKKIWPELFEHFEVHFVPSSKPMCRPERKKSLFAESIIGRMTSDPTEMQEFRDFARSLQGFDLDKRIQLEYSRDFRPIVHCEVLLLEWLKKNRGISPQQFFNDWMYIGSSKPTCQLCHYYFEEHQSSVGHRPSHGNLYVNWRLPDEWQSLDGNETSDTALMMTRMLDRIRRDTFDLVRNKVPSRYKKHDSNTFSANMTHQETWVTEGNSAVEPGDSLGDAMSRFGGLSLSDE